MIWLAVEAAQTQHGGTAAGIVGIIVILLLIYAVGRLLRGFVRARRGARTGRSERPTVTDARSAPVSDLAQNDPSKPSEQVRIDIRPPGPGMAGPSLHITPPGDTAPLVFAWRDDGFYSHNDVHILCHGFDIGDHRDHYGIPGCLVFQLAGGTFHSAAMRKHCFSAGRPVMLVPEPDNPVDPNAIAVWDTDRTVKAGHVPRDLSAALADALDGEAVRGLIVLEWKRSSQRVGLTILTGRPLDDPEGR